MWDLLASLDPRVQAALISGAVSFVVAGGTVIAGLFTPIGAYLKDRFQLRDRLKTEYEHEQRKKLRGLIGSYHGRVLQAAEEMNYRLFNLYANEGEPWLEVPQDGQPDRKNRYRQVGHDPRYYYFQTTVYRFLALMSVVRSFEEKALYVDSRIAEVADFAFLKYLRAMLWVATDVTLFDGLTYDRRRSTDHLFKDDLRRVCGYCLKRDENGGAERTVSLDEFRQMMGEQEALESVLDLFNGLRRGEERRHRWDRMVALHLLLLAFIRDFGHAFQRPEGELIHEVAGRFETVEVPGNLLGWLPKLGLDGEGSMVLVGEALEEVLTTSEGNGHQTSDDQPRP